MFKHNNYTFKPLYTDLPLQFLGELLTYLDCWEESVKKRKGPFSAADRKQMTLSDVTLNGIRITGIPHLFISL